MKATSLPRVAGSRAYRAICTYGAICALVGACQSRVADRIEPTAAPATSLTRLGALQAPTLVEASGSVASTRKLGVFWSQNDSGNEPELFAYDSTGAALGVARVTGAVNRDWEAIAIGPCNDGSCLYIGDVGDNSAGQSSVVIWRVIEPTPGDTATSPSAMLRVRYPGGPRDVEAMWVAPDTSLWLVTKRPLLAPDGTSRRVQLFRVPGSAWGAAGVQLAELVDSLPIVPLASNDRSWVTDASISAPDSTGARHLAVRTYEQVYVFAVDPQTGRPGKLASRCSLTALRERQGEGVAWLADGRLIFVSEGRAAPLQAARCP